MRIWPEKPLFEGWSWVQFSNLGLSLGMTFKSYTSVAKGLKNKKLEIPVVSTIENIDSNLLDLIEPALIKTLLFGSYSFDTNTNTNALNGTIKYLLSTKTFKEPPFQWIQ